MKMSATKEVWGLRCELTGLLIVLLATVWQATFTDWFDRTSRDWLGYIQEEVNISLLRSLDDLSGQVQELDETKKRELRLKVYDETSAAIFKAIEQRDQRNALAKGQEKIFGTIRYLLLALGAALIIFGKWLVLVHKRSNP